MAQPSSSNRQTDVDPELLPYALIRVDNKGWDFALFSEQAKATTVKCTHCQSVCCDAVELGCDHSDEELGLLYCNQCLLDLINDNHNKCIIDSHEKPIIIESRSTRRIVSTLNVACPFTLKYKSRRQQLAESKASKNDANLIVDTLGNDDEEKEGTTIAPAAAGTKAACEWEGSFKQLIKSHLFQCAQKNDPAFLLNLKIKKLESENGMLRQQMVSMHKRNIALVDEMNQYKKKVAKLENDVKEQNLIIQDILNNNNKQQKETELAADHFGSFGGDQLGGNAKTSNDPFAELMNAAKTDSAKKEDLVGDLDPFAAFTSTEDPFAESHKEHLQNPYTMAHEDEHSSDDHDDWATFADTNAVPPKDDPFAQLQQQDPDDFDPFV